MTASKKPATPTMSIPLVAAKAKDTDGKTLAESTAQQLSRVCVSEFVKSVEVCMYVCACMNLCVCVCK